MIYSLVSFFQSLYDSSFIVDQHRILLSLLGHVHQEWFLFSVFVDVRLDLLKVELHLVPLEASDPLDLLSHFLKIVVEHDLNFCWHFLVDLHNLALSVADSAEILRVRNARFAIDMIAACNEELSLDVLLKLEARVAKDSEAHVVWLFGFAGNDNFNLKTSIMAIVERFRHRFNSPVQFTVVTGIVCTRTILNFVWPLISLPSEWEMSLGQQWSCFGWCITLKYFCQIVSFQWRLNNVLWPRWTYEARRLFKVCQQDGLLDDAL